MSDHTPEPWTWLNYPDGRKLLCGPNNAVIHCPDAPINISEADQNLIAVAPDLLGRLEALLAATERGEVLDHHVRSGWAAVAKAKGETV